MTHQVLIVSDKEETTSELKSVLEQQNIEVLCVSSVAAALDGFAKHSYCLVFIDINLSWSEKTEMIRVMRNIKIVPIIVLTGPLKKEDLKELFQAGASVIVKKPVDYEICAMQVNNFIDLYSNIENSVSKNHPIVCYEVTPVNLEKPTKLPHQNMQNLQRHMKGTKTRRYRHWPVCYTRIGYRRQMVLRQLCHLWSWIESFIRRHKQIAGS